MGVGAPLTLLPDDKLLAGNQRHFTGSGHHVPEAVLGFTWTPGGLELAWPAGYRLQHTSILLPADWQDVVVTSPYLALLTGAGGYFRLVDAP